MITPSYVAWVGALVQQKLALKPRHCCFWQAVFRHSGPWMPIKLLRSEHLYPCVTESTSQISIAADQNCEWLYFSALYDVFSAFSGTERATQLTYYAVAIVFLCAAA